MRRRKKEEEEKREEEEEEEEENEFSSGFHSSLPTVALNVRNTDKNKNARQPSKKKGGEKVENFITENGQKNPMMGHILRTGKEKRRRKKRKIHYR